MNALKSLAAAAVALGIVAFAGTASAAAFLESLDANDFANFGYVDENNPLHYSHTFSPSEDVASIGSVYLAVGVTDDWQCVRIRACLRDAFLQPEQAVVDLNGVDWKEGQATFNVFFGEISAEASITAVGDTLDVTVSSDNGDFAVYSSKMLVFFTEDTSGGGGGGTSIGPSNAVPEPSAALVFLIGGLTISRGLRRRS